MATEKQVVAEMLAELKLEGYSSLITKKDYAEIIGCSVSKINHLIGKGYGLPDYIKMGESKQAQVRFRLKDVAEFLASQKVKVA